MKAPELENSTRGFFEGKNVFVNLPPRYGKLPNECFSAFQIFFFAEAAWLKHSCRISPLRSVVDHVVFSQQDASAIHGHDRRGGSRQMVAFLKLKSLAHWQLVLFTNAYDKILFTRLLIFRSKCRFCRDFRRLGYNPLDSRRVLNLWEMLFCWWIWLRT